MKDIMAFVVGASALVIMLVGMVLPWVVGVLTLFGFKLVWGE